MRGGGCRCRRHSARDVNFLGRCETAVSGAAVESARDRDLACRACGESLPSVVYWSKGWEVDKTKMIRFEKSDTRA